MTEKGEQVMNRLTYWNHDIEGWSYHCPSGDAAVRLAAYENTGFAPEDVSGLLASYQESEKCLSRIERIISDLGSLNHIKDLVQKEKDGLMAVFPCKAGDTVYVIADCADVMKLCDDDYYDGTGDIQCPFEKDCDFEECDDGNKRIFETKCTGFWLEQMGSWKVFLDYISADIGISDFGKTAFTDPNEAKAALKEMEGTDGKAD